MPPSVVAVIDRRQCGDWPQQLYLLCQLLRVLSVDAVGVKLCSHLIDLLTQHVFDSPHILAGDRVELLLQLLDIRRHVGLILVVLPQQTQKTTAPL